MYDVTGTFVKIKDHLIRSPRFLTSDISKILWLHDCYDWKR